MKTELIMILTQLFQILAILCFIVIIKSVGSVIAGKTEPSLLILSLFSAIIFQSLTYIFNKKIDKN